MNSNVYEPVSHPPIKLKLYDDKRRTKIPKDLYDTLNLEKGAELHLQVIGVMRPNGRVTSVRPKEKKDHKKEEASELPEEPEGVPGDTLNISTPEEDLKQLKELGVSDGTILTIKELGEEEKKGASDEAIRSLQKIAKGNKGA